MPLLARSVPTPIAVRIRSGALDDLGQVLADSRISGGGDVAVVVGPGLGPQIADRAARLLTRATVISVTGGCVDAALELGAKLRASGCEAVVGIGGGRTIDTVKYAASRHGLPMVSVATSLAHDGIASPVSVLERDGASVSYGVQTPFAVLVDLEYVRRGPARQTRSGIGDALSNLSATADWELAHQARGEQIDGLAVALARTGAEAVLHHTGGVTDEDFLATLANALVLGGVAMSVAGTSLPCSGGCHEIAHAITARHPGRGTHGEQVALGALFCTFLREETKLFDQLRSTLARHGLPCTPTGLGLTEAQFADAVEHAPTTRPGRYTVLEHVALPAPAIVAAVAAFVRAVGEVPPR